MATIVLSDRYDPALAMTFLATQTTTAVSARKTGGTVRRAGNRDRTMRDSHYGCCISNRG